MEIANQNKIEIFLDKVPSLISDENGNHRGEDAIIIRIPNVEDYDNDLIQDNVLHLSFTNNQALRLAQQLIDCVMKNVDKAFIEAFPGVPPF